MRVEHEDERGGALAYLAAWDVHQAKLFGRCEQATGIAPFGRLVEEVMTTEPYASATRVFWVVDNGSSHRVGCRWSGWRAHGPTCAWSTCHPRLLAQPGRDLFLDRATQGLDPNDFTDLVEVERCLLAFQRRDQQTAMPFDWRYTRADLDRLLRRLEGRQQHATAA